jgi:hypothetical protein
MADTKTVEKSTPILGFWASGVIAALMLAGLWWLGSTFYGWLWEFGWVNDAIVGLWGAALLQIVWVSIVLPVWRSITGNPMLDELAASAKKSVLMGESAHFPSKEEHKLSGKFK